MKKITSHQRIFLPSVLLILFHFVQPIISGTNYADSMALRMILDSNGLTNLPVDSISHERNYRIVFVDLSYRSIKKLLGIELKTLSALETLYVAHNAIDSFPPEIGALKSLKLLDFSYNNLASLPDSITNLSNFSKPPVCDSHDVCTKPGIIDVSHNRLCSIPARIAEWLDSCQVFWSNTQNCTGASQRNTVEKPNRNVIRFNQKQRDIFISAPVKTTRLSLYDLSGKLVKSYDNEQRGKIALPRSGIFLIFYAIGTDCFFMKVISQ